MDINVNGITIHYQNAGTGPAIILLHGNGETHQIYEGLVNYLSADYQVYAIDSRGHGKSSKTKHLSYHDMTEDIADFIKKLQIEKPILYGFSDGGIVGLLLASKYPDLLSRMIISGANTHPDALKTNWKYLIKLSAFFTNDPKIKLMAKEPDITKKELHKITIPVLVLAGEKDMVKQEDTAFIAANIADATLKIIEKETHDSYVMNNDKLYPLIKAFLP